MITCNRVLLTIGVGLLTLQSIAQPPSGKPGAGGAPPFAGAAKMSCEDALKKVIKDDPSLGPDFKKWKIAYNNLKKRKKNKVAIKAYGDNCYVFGYKVELDEKLSPQVKYRAALALLRRALIAYPKQKQAATEKKKIEDIYIQMGRPIPK